MKRVILGNKFSRVVTFLIAAFIIFGSLDVVSSGELMEKQAFQYFNEALEAQGTGDIDHAVSLYMKAIYANPNYVQAFNNLGTAYAQKGEIIKAEELYNQAVAIDPYYSVALKNIALIYADRGNYEKFLEYWRRASGLDVFTPFIIDYEG